MASKEGHAHPYPGVTGYAPQPQGHAHQQPYLGPYAQLPQQPIPQGQPVVYYTHGAPQGGAYQPQYQQPGHYPQPHYAHTVHHVYETGPHLPTPATTALILGIVACVLFWPACCCGFALAYQAKRMIGDDVTHPDYKTCRAALIVNWLAVALLIAVVTFVVIWVTTSNSYN